LFDEWMRRRRGPQSTDFRLRHFADPVLGEAMRDLQDKMKEAAEASVLHASFDCLMRRVHFSFATTSESGTGGSVEQQGTGREERWLPL
jgi:hypothetical protein